MPVATQKTDTGLTMGLLKILHRQVNYILFIINFNILIILLKFSPKGILSLNEIKSKFDDLNIPREQFDDIVQIGTFNNEVQWENFFTIAVSKLSKVKLFCK